MIIGHIVPTPARTQSSDCVAGGKSWACSGKLLDVGGGDSAAGEVTVVTVLWSRPWLTGSSWPWIYPAKLILQGEHISNGLPGRGGESVVFRLCGTCVSFTGQPVRVLPRSLLGKAGSGNG